MYTIDQLQSIAEAAHKSNLYTNTVGNRDAIFMLLLAANEVNIPPAMALSGGIHPMKGKFEISARMMNMLMRKAGHTIKIKQSDYEGCRIWGRRKDTGEEYEVFYGPSDAKKQGLGGAMYQKYGDDMYFARGVSKFARRLTPDCIGTFYVEGELDDVQEQEQIAPESSSINDLADIIESDRNELNNYLRCINEKSKVPIDTLVKRAHANPEKFKEALLKWRESRG